MTHLVKVGTGSRLSMPIEVGNVDQLVVEHETRIGPLEQNPGLNMRQVAQIPITPTVKLRNAEKNSPFSVVKLLQATYLTKFTKYKEM